VTVFIRSISDGRGHDRGGRGDDRGASDDSCPSIHLHRIRHIHLIQRVLPQ